MSHGQRIENETWINIFKRIKNMIELENLYPKAQTIIKKQNNLKTKTLLALSKLIFPK